MRITSESSDAAVLEELGSRLSRHRLNRNQTQDSLATQASVSQRTVIRIERGRWGRSAQFSSMVRVMRALDLLDNMEALVPAPPLSPIQQVRLQGDQAARICLFEHIAHSRTA